MNNYFEEIKEKLSRQIKIEQIEVIDNTKKHQNHKFFVKDKYHLHLKIKSQYLLTKPILRQLDFRTFFKWRMNFRPCDIQILNRKLTYLKQKSIQFL